MNPACSRLFALFLIAGSYWMATPCQARDPGELFPELSPFKEGRLQAGKIHSLWYGLLGNPDGKPVIVLHGGPGAGCYPRLTQYFNPEKFLIILHDQRGAGQSRPAGELRENTTWDLVEDINRLREHLKIKGKTLIFGGSWGTCLGLAYAEKYPENVSGMILRGIFTGTQAEISQVCAGPGMRLFFPDAVKRLQAAMPDGAEITPKTLYGLLVEGDRATSWKAAEAWVRYGIKTSRLHAPHEKVNMDFGDWDIRPICRIDAHYMINRCFLEEAQLLLNADRLKDIPVTIINGRYDMICPPLTAYKLHEQAPNSKLYIVEETGHSETEPGTTRKLLEAVADFE